jgi:K+-transporting ATPase ATPase C chain
MNSSVLSQFRPALVLLVLFSALTGLVYPYTVAALARVLFPAQAAGSLVVVEGKPIGSALIGQGFSDPAHFWSRPSATNPKPYDASNSSGSNLGPSNPALSDAVRARIAALRATDPGNSALVPVDLVTASGSGLDPHISLAAARYQQGRVARASGLAPEKVAALVDAQTEGRLFGLIGEPHVNVLALNLALNQALEAARGTRPPP